MTIDQLQEGYYYFLREVYSLTGIVRRFRGHAYELPRAASHLARNYLVSRYGMIKTAHAIRRKSARPVNSIGATEHGTSATSPRHDRAQPAASPRRVKARPIADASNARG